MKKIDLDAVKHIPGTGYPPPYDVPCRNRSRQALGDAAGLTQFGVNLQRLPPGAWSSQRHWHSDEDEFVWVVSGELTLVTDNGEEVMRAGDCVGFKAGVRDGHHLQNRSTKEAVVLAIGSRRPNEDLCSYPDIDLRWAGSGHPTHRDGTPY
jgi:uncharacterized cupin superfamily protein